MTINKKDIPIEAIIKFQSKEIERLTNQIEELKTENIFLKTQIFGNKKGIKVANKMVNNTILKYKNKLKRQQRIFDNTVNNLKIKENQINVNLIEE